MATLLIQTSDEQSSHDRAVRCAVDTDRVADALWQKVREGYPGGRDMVRERPPAGAKDWNEALRGQHEHEQPNSRDGSAWLGDGRTDRRR